MWLEEVGVGDGGWDDVCRGGGDVDVEVMEVVDLCG